MLKTVYRISVMYLVTVVLIRLAGKKEIAQLEVSELVTSFMVSEIACMPITDPDVPLVHAIVFSVTVVVLEILLSKASIGIPAVKHLTTGKPGFIVVRGRINMKELKKANVSISELVSAMRTRGITAVSKINYAVQEPDGNISVVPYKAPHGQEEQEDRCGIEHVLVCDGKFNKSEMKTFGYTKNDVMEIIRKNGFDSEKDLFFLGVDDMENVTVISG